MIAGLIGHGPMSHFWYNICDGFFADTLHLTAWWAFIPKVFIDQTLWGPIWNNTYLLLIGLMKMERLDVIWEDIKKSTVPMVVSGLKLWPAAHTVTYGLIPIENRLLWVDMVEIIWVTVLSKQAASLDKQDTNDIATATEESNDGVSFQQS
jgi:protein Mpv17